jgi:ABC-type branched-subunit amino acid transport system substrate-binding protein
VVEVLGTGFDARGVPWLEMEWAPGVSLQALSDAVPVPWDLYVAVIGELLGGLHAAHTVVGDDGRTLELVHRDVSPHNVLVTYDGHAKVIDFGIAKVRDSTLQTTTGVVKGKATYLAPEQAARARVDARTDLFAVGVMLWQQLAGRRMWEDISEPEIFHRLIAHDIPDLRAAAPQVEESIVRVVQRALAPDPEARFASAAELRDALLQASPPRPTATADLARLVRESFADELREIEQRVRVRSEAPGDAARNRAAGSVGPSPETTVTRRARFRPGRLALTVVALAIGVVAFDALRAPPDAPLAPVLVRCTSEASCGAGRHCRDDGTCVGLEHDGCAVIPSNAGAGSRPIYLGAMFPLSGPDAEDYGRFNARAAELAVREVNGLAGGIPVGAERRPLGLILCDDAVDAKGRAQFLSTRVPAVIGFGDSDEALQLSRDVFMPNGVLVLSALNMSALLAQMPAGRPRLFYRTTASANEFAPAIARAIESMLGPRARERLRLAAGDKLRVAVVRSEGATGFAYAESVLRALERVPGIDAREVAVGDPSSPDNGVLASAVAMLDKMGPHVVITLNDKPFPTLIAPLEQRLHRPDDRRPLYMGATPWEDSEFRTFIAAEPRRRARFFAISWPTTHRPLHAFITRYNEAFHEEITAATASPGPYDAVYLLAYAAAAAEGRDITGGALSLAIARLGPGTPGASAHEVGPAMVIDGLARVAHGERVDLQGVISRFDFDDATGDSPFDAVVLCTTYDPARKLVDAVDLPIAPGPFECP